MSLTEVVPMVQALPHEDKRQLLALLRRDLDASEESDLVNSLANTRQEFWSPFDANEAAEKMEQLLRSSEVKK